MGATAFHDVDSASRFGGVDTPLWASTEYRTHTCTDVMSRHREDVRVGRVNGDAL